MLPTVRNIAIAATTSIALAAATVAPAHAGKNEDNFLKGVAAAVLVGTIYNQVIRPQQQQRQVYRQPVYQQPTYQQPTYNFVEPRRTQSTSVYQTPAARAFATYSLSERRLIQRRLAAEGYYHGGIDGAFGPGTYSAVTAYARDSRSADRLSTTAGAFAVYDGLVF
ncbi:MAG: peptidoglycan-binding domain-containing protein [Pseudomonadota bacterium]|jgi:hypothetical protein